MKTLTLGYSPCPNDTFIFYAMIHGKVDTKNLIFREQLLDVENLNQMALQTELDMTKISYHTFGHVHKKYCLLRAGGALGRGCGPIVISKNAITLEELRNKRIAIPGKLTTAFLLLQLYDPAFSSANLFIMPFHKIIEAVSNEEVDAGLIIHESRFTYPAYGLRLVTDLGEWWERETGLPIPLGGIIAKRSLGEGLHKKTNKILKASVEYAFNHRTEPMVYIKKHSQELSDFDVGAEGEKAVTELLSRASNTGIIPEIKQSIFI
jgi:1,4-dihydroxy-6-naphthoate synthase